MIDKVARALYDATPFKQTEGGYGEQSETYRRMCELLARAAIEAMRQPTDAMIDVGTDELVKVGAAVYDIEPIWEALIDTALMGQTP